MEEILKLIEQANLILSPLLSLLLGGLGGFGYIKFKMRQERRFFSNLQKTVALIPSDKHKLETEKRLLETTALFKNVDLHPNLRDLNFINNQDCRVAVLGYDKDTFENTFQTLKDKGIPIIVYCEFNELDRDRNHPEIIRDYPHASNCNTTVRLVSDIMVVMNIFPI